MTTDWTNPLTGVTHRQPERGPCHTCGRRHDTASAAVTWCSSCGAPVDAGRCTNTDCALSRKTGAPEAYARRVRELDRMAKSALLDVLARHARERGVSWLIGGPRLWSKDELINGILGLEFPAPETAGNGGAR